jgi:hypothetical protein
MSHDLLAELCPPPAEEALRLSSQSPSVASSSPARTSLFSHSSALSDSQITALDVLEQQAAAGVGSSIAATLKTGLKHVSAWLPASWASDAAEESPEAAAVASARVLKIQQMGRDECCVIVADSHQLQLWEVLVSTGMPLLKTTVEEKSCVDALICGSNGRFVAIVSEVLEDPEAHDLKLADSTTGRILAAQRLAKLAVGLQSMAGFLLVQHAAGVSVYRLEQLEFVRHISTASSAISTSNRWLAFEGPPAKSSSSSSSQQQQDASPSKAAYDVGDTARTVVAGIVGLSKAAHKHLSPILKSGGWEGGSSAGGGAAGGQTRSRSNSEGTKSPIKAPVGWVGIYHVHTDARSNSGNVSDTSSEQYDEAQPQAFELQRLANFQASSETIAAMQFSPSGTKLACAPVTGQVILVYNLVKPQLEVVYEASKWLEQSKRLRVDLAFKLVRGYTPSRVLSLQFSTREDRLCAVSSRGTVHVFEMPKPKRPESSSGSSSSSSSTTLPTGAMSVDKLLSAIPSSSTVPEQQALFRIKVPRRQAAQSRTPSTDDDPGAAAAAAATMYPTEARRSSHPGAGPSTLPGMADAATEQPPHEPSGKVRDLGGRASLSLICFLICAVSCRSAALQDSLDRAPCFGHDPKPAVPAQLHGVRPRQPPCGLELVSGGVLRCDGPEEQPAQGGAAAGGAGDRALGPRGFGAVDREARNRCNHFQAGSRGARRSLQLAAVCHGRDVTAAAGALVAEATGELLRQQHERPVGIAAASSVRHPTREPARGGATPGTDPDATIE